ncbi:FAD dependent oxidoreductase [Yamadazyma tenuis ATCC 10573]|uniref:FAD dependent oxidoreductase n=1 Tax=Candida tenuis (strain ATCC 10573 / BCRC 21748 / CBS 615 / JCM 9827 / NBRC 10315 / NRRL Y-1498 / VKM Y-70) TaxID=590646 RepID=G3AWZ9_CANTC|nr:uncharacterized protein CANTEDRAFT_117799 [Yamadazyma tenuis ATCC 10573]XP_006683910.1 FAD dependent oxidoreductase [Yamadazyma tenuis ATCC 10573]EGV66651.1 hypothetical protein CANTEDRAFT_117799 [Yamadazyma tenuis ATCC 10573]EGV66652.1 FAD dependent oxidoreductase [Yamadazyma tenuis ATCC 10573]
MSIVIVGAGILGLYTAFELIESGKPPASVRIVAEFTPGDYSHQYTSPWAGAYFSAGIELQLIPYSKYTYENLPRLQEKLGTACGLARTVCIEYSEDKVVPEDLQHLQFIRDLEIIDDKYHGIKFSGWTFNPPKLTKKLLQYLLDKGVCLDKRRVQTLEEASDEQTQIVFNCSGNGARELAHDSSCHPVRGQVVVVSAPEIKEVVTLWSSSESTYVIPRPDSELHEVVLGGLYQDNNGDIASYEADSQDILERVSRLYPGISTSFERVVRVATGLRPGRDGGPRVERENTASGVVVVHNYGAGGCGYLMGFGMAHTAVSLME